jgi:hypothetical protein
MRPSRGSAVSRPWFACGWCVMICVSGLGGARLPPRPSALMKLRLARSGQEGVERGLNWAGYRWIARMER